MMQLDEAGVFAGLAANDEAGEQFAERGVEMELATLMKQHSGGSGGDDLGEAGDIKDCLRGDCGRIWFIRELAQCAVEGNFAAGEDTESAAGKGVGGDGFIEHAKGVCEPTRWISREVSGRIGYGLHSRAAGLNLSG